MWQCYVGDIIQISPTSLFLIPSLSLVKVSFALIKERVELIMLRPMNLNHEFSLGNVKIRKQPAPRQRNLLQDSIVWELLGQEGSCTYMVL